VTARSLKRISRKDFLFLRVGIVMVVTAMLMNVALTTFYNQVLQDWLAEGWDWYPMRYSFHVSY
jgi:hypothetical protein